MPSISILAAPLLAAVVAAQQTLVVPPTAATNEANAASSIPWSQGPVSTRAQFVYAAANFAAVAGPIAITRLRWRANLGETTPGGQYGAATIDLSTAPVNHSLMATTFVSNHGADRLRVFAGSVTVAQPAGSLPNTWYVDVPLAVPFPYDPASGGLTVDLATDGSMFTGTPPSSMDTQIGALAQASRVHDSGNHLAATGTVQNDLAPVLEVTYAQQGLYANFAATPTSGPSPLLVQFVDRTVTSDPGGVLSWAWDFDDDGTIDSTLQNPQHTYPSCGDFDVRLTVTDGSHPTSSIVKPDFVRTDLVSPSFTFALLAAPSVFQFTDTTTPPASAWAWDFDEDGIVDSTVQNPIFTTPGGCFSSRVSLTATRQCHSGTTARPVVLSATPAAISTVEGNHGTSSTDPVGNLFDIDVTAAEGLDVCGLVLTPYLMFGPFDVEVYLTEDTFVGKESNLAAWRRVGTGQGIAMGGSFVNPIPLDVAVTRFHVPFGKFGMAVFCDNPSGHMTIAYTAAGLANPPPPFVTPDVIFHSSGAIGVTRTALFGGLSFSPRLWNGGFYYNKCSSVPEASYGFLGTGCAGSLPTATLDAVALPRLGSTLVVDLDNLPTGAAMLFLGLSNSVSSLGPLPVDLTALGAPGCSGRVRPDSSSLLLGSGTTATWTLPVPSLPALTCLRFYNQALVLDPAANALGAVMSDAAAGTIGF